VTLIEAGFEGLSLERFVDLTAHGPQRIFGLATKGGLRSGSTPILRSSS
jgi:dihydroorotase-like cyclic amidohydrolase